MLAVVLATLLGGTLLLAGIPKLRDRESMLRAIQGYRLLPAPLERVAAAALPIVEVILGSALIIGGPLARPAAAAAAALFFVFAAALALNLAKGRRELDCGCFAFATDESHTPRISWFHAIRAAVLAATAGALAVSSSGFGVGTLPTSAYLLGIAIGGLALAAIFAAAAVRQIINPGRRGLDSHLAGARQQLRASAR